MRNMVFTVTSSNSKSKSRGLLNFYPHQVEDVLEINLIISFESCGDFRLENTAF